MTEVGMIKIFNGDTEETLLIFSKEIFYDMC